MTITYATVKADGRVVIPARLRSKFQIEEGTRIAFLEEKGRLLIQPVTNMFIDSMKGVLAANGFPDCIEQDTDRRLR
jgi:AbrB family looped-hinge helix DNA binding protein